MCVCVCVCVCGCGEACELHHGKYDMALWCASASQKIDISRNSGGTAAGIRSTQHHHQQSWTEEATRRFGKEMRESCYILMVWF